MAFYILAHEESPFYGMMFAYDALLALKDDMYPLLIAKAIWSAYFSDSQFLTKYLSGVGFNHEDILTLITDSTYGFANYATLKLWIIAILEYRNSGTLDDGAGAILLNHFQFPQLPAVLSAGGFLWEAIDAVLVDMVSRYGSSDPLQLAYLQWARLGVLGNLPLGQGSLSMPYYQGLNYTSFDYPLEIRAFQMGINSTVDLLPQAANLLNPQYTYPMNNTSSLLSIDNLTPLYDNYFAGDYAAIVSQFNLSSEEQVLPIVEWLGYIGDYTIQLPNEPVVLDGYSMVLARHVRKSLVNETTTLRYDAYYGAMARALFCTYQREDIICEEVMAQANVSDFERVCRSMGWNTSHPETWVSLQPWLEAALKSSESAAFKQLESQGLLTFSELSAILYSGPLPMSSAALRISHEFSTHYRCAKTNCTYDELFYLQLGSSGVTNNLPAYFQECGIQNTTTMQDWLPARYRTPIEWLHIQKFPMPSFLASSYLTFGAFLDPTMLRIFFHDYFSGNFGDIIDTFAFPNNEFIYLFYNYFKQVVPGFGFIMTDTVDSFVYGGGVNTYLDFLSSMTIYECGSPSTNPFYRLSTFTNDTEQAAKHIMYSGKNDSSLTRTYYAFYGHNNMDMYWPGYDGHSPTASSWSYSDIWQGNNPVNGTDGGQFGTKIKDDDHPYVYVSSLLRSFELSRVGTDHYHGLELGHFVMSPWQLKNSDEVPINAVFYQLSNVLDGFMNISSQMGNAPIMVNLPHCYLCNESGMNMIEYYAYTNDSEKYMSERITPHQTHDQPYAAIEQETGVGVQLVLIFQVNICVQKDYFYPDFYQEEPGMALYFPFYVLTRSVNYTEDQVRDNFGPLILARRLKVVFLLVGTIVGSVLTVLGLILGVWYCRKIRKAPEGDTVRRSLVSDQSGSSSNNSKKVVNIAL